MSTKEQKRSTLYIVAYKESLELTGNGSPPSPFNPSPTTPQHPINTKSIVAFATYSSIPTVPAANTPSGADFNSLVQKARMRDSALFVGPSARAKAVGFDELVVVVVVGCMTQVRR